MRYMREPVEKMVVVEDSGAAVLIRILQGAETCKAEM
jgi:hypothetical protein